MKPFDYFLVILGGWFIYKSNIIIKNKTSPDAAAFGYAVGISLIGIAMWRIS